MRPQISLGIETSCDDTSVALVNHQGLVLAQMMASQVKGHLPFGGVVPEVASRLHAEALLPLIDHVMTSFDEGWAGVDLISVSSRPGLIGSLLVGVVTAKTLGLALKKPLIGVNHIHGHIFSPFLHEQSQSQFHVNFPYISLVVSGGHTHLYLVKSFVEIYELGKTRDDAAGEAFDKFANLLRLGFPGGPLVDRLAQGGNPKAYAFPRALLKSDQYEFSFSGLKASAARLIQTWSQPISEQEQKDLCASFQEAICDVLLHQLHRACQSHRVQHVSISGGVSANGRLRERVKEWADKESLSLHIPPPLFCTDNAAMIAFTGLKQYDLNSKGDQALTPSSRALPKDYL